MKDSRTETVLFCMIIAIIWRLKGRSVSSEKQPNTGIYCAQLSHARKGGQEGGEFWASGLEVRDPDFPGASRRKACVMG